MGRFTTWIVGMLLAVTASVHSSSYCDNFGFEIPQCAQSDPRDLLFLVDGSLSMDRERFFNEMLDYCLALYCAFDESEPNQAGMILFNQVIRTILPLQQQSRNQWFNSVQLVRDTKDNATFSACCSCCTPTADAFVEANAEFTRNKREGNIQVAFVITDGVPSNNNNDGVSEGNPDWLFTSAQAGFDPSSYNAAVVPNQAIILKEQARLMLVGVPNVDGDPPDQRYFNGGFNNGHQYCLTRDQREFCTAYRKPPFPITSEPVDLNSFSSDNWDVEDLIDRTVGALCIIEVTNAPTGAPMAPTFSPTALPTKLPTRLPTNLPTISPTRLDLEQVDLTFLLDRSRSMLWSEEQCAEVLQDANGMESIQSMSSCWHIQLEYVLQQVDELTSYQFAGAGMNRELGWYDDFLPQEVLPRKGLRVNIIGFACQNEQRTPKVFRWSEEKAGGPITNRAALVELLNTLGNEIIPDHGTCPGLAIEEAVLEVEKAPEAEFPLTAVILFTDGVFYDSPHPEMAVKGLAKYGTLRLAIGIAVGNDEFPFGLTRKERRTQRHQLRSFVGEGNEELFFNLGTNGWTQILDEVAADVAAQVTTRRSTTDTIPRGYWCGNRRKNMCSANGWHGRLCRWKRNGPDQWSCRLRRKAAKALKQSRSET